MIRIASIEDDPVFQRVLLDNIAKEPEMLCIIKAADIDDFLERLKPFHQIDLLLLDIHLPGYSGVEALPILKKQLPDTTVIMCTMEEEPAMLFKAFTRGAEGYLLKNTPMEDIREALHVAMRGGAAISPFMARHLIQHFTLPQRPKNHKSLGEKDLLILKLLAQGWSYQNIAEKAGISINGVRYYIRKIYKRLDINSRHEATNLFRENPDLLNHL